MVPDFWKYHLHLNVNVLEEEEEEEDYLILKLFKTLNAIKAK